MRRAIVAVQLALVACTPALREGYYGCATDDDCPSGWVCRADDRCWSSDADAGSAEDAGTDAGGEEDACTPRPRPVDLLLMVDDSHSMAEEQESLTRAFPELVRALSTGDLEPDGTRDFEPVADLHVGVVTSDMGTFGYTAPTCDDPDFGADGILRTQGNTTLTGCAESYPSFLSYAPGGALSQFRTDFTCVATAGTMGCGLEQQLEAVLKALTPSASALRFHADTRGHGDAENAGFLRDDSVLVVLLVTDEDDCSASDPQLFDLGSGSPYAATEPNLRCSMHPDALHPFTRYVDGLRALRAGRPEHLVFAALAGVPPDLEESAHDELMADERMQYRVDPATDTSLLPACDSSEGVAFPARRIATTAEELRLLGSASLVRSICRADFDAPLRDLLSIVAPRLVPVCD